MAVVRPLPQQGTVLFDVRGDDRALRMSWHEDAGLVVLSIWHGELCTGTFRLTPAEVPDLIDSLVDVLRHTAPRPLSDAG